MTTLVPRPPYTQEELQRLYPANLELQLVQVLLRHGERAPVSTRFGNAGLPPYWPYCNAAKRMRSVAMTPTDAAPWDSLQWRRRLERFGDDDGPVIAAGPAGEVDGVCQLGELTDKGRQTVYSLGERLRRLYVHQLGFMPPIISSADSIYLRATPIPRALESVQQAFWGMYPLTARTASFPPPTIVTRTPADETLFPNESNCRRFAQLSRAFAQRAADRWNDSDDLKYVNSVIGKWMPESSPAVAVDSHPRLSGVMDTINSTLAHGPETRLPKEFYDKKSLAAIDKIAVEEWFAGYNESLEYRKLGIGGLMGDIVERMCAVVEGSGLSIREVGGENGQLDQGRGGEKNIRFAMSGCHDTTLAAILSSLGAYEEEKWPPYTSHIAVEMFKIKSGHGDPDQDTQLVTTLHNNSITNSESTTTDTTTPSSSKPGWLASMLGLSSSSPAPARSSSPSTILNSLTSNPSTIARRPYNDLNTSEKSSLSPYYVRLRYNDRPITIPACRAPGNHLSSSASAEGAAAIDDPSFCTLEAFKRVVDSYTPRNWKAECGMNLNATNSDTGTIKVDVPEKGNEHWAGRILE